MGRRLVSQKKVDCRLCKRSVEVTDDKIRNHRTRPGGLWCDGSNSALISDHLYDCGPAEETGGPCLVAVDQYSDCGQPRDAHQATEYDPQEHGSMHEPKPYPVSRLQFEDDSYDHLLHPYVD
jgi:hypothetical protein